MFLQDTIKVVNDNQLSEKNWNTYLYAPKPRDEKFPDRTYMSYPEVHLGGANITIATAIVRIEGRVYAGALGIVLNSR